MYLKFLFLQIYRRAVFYVKSTNQHGIHSPFLFSLYCNVLIEKYPFYIFEKIESRRKSLLVNKTEIKVENFGADSYLGTSEVKKIKDIARFSLADVATSQMFFRLVHTLKCNQILELGTSFGISTAYLASANPKSKVYTFEGSVEILQQADKNWKDLGLKNIVSIQGNLKKTLSEFLTKEQPKLDLVYVDANHTYEGARTIIAQIKPYLHNETVVILDDINWSTDMRKIWEELKSDSFFSLTFENHRLGFLFLRREQPKEHFYLRFCDVF